MEISNSIKKDVFSGLENHIQRSKNGKIKTKISGGAQYAVNITIFILLILTIYGFYTFDYKNLIFADASLKLLDNLKTVFLHPKPTHFTLVEGVYQVIITLGLAFLTTLIGAAIALITGLFAAKNLSNVHISNSIKAFVAFIRAVPTVLWVLIFAVAAGLGSVAAVIGLSLHSVAYLTKVYSESYEDVDSGVIEALKASGANWWQIVFQAVLPSTFTSLLAWTFMRFEINFTNAVAMGAAAGAGGIGFDLFMAGSFYYYLPSVGVIAYLILAFALLLEVFSTRMKNKYLA
ncbi:PhnE/PtxC family ABC transporter permease [Clostridium lacusfryxellense]|uniref:PhnE/PtxC family ABC transporter permease n=1 Tax=Clostridium lacusfryxellense TaxID=205328 RepID=UPI001C0E0F2D|nr:ABC transporter permease subunit [Clostridium lacusfryxellense]MBU3112523.1 ABC transporter permease subunit [Clostridium lacusfryxellense]